MQYMRNFYISTDKTNKLTKYSRKFKYILTEYMIKDNMCVCSFVGFCFSVAHFFSYFLIGDDVRVDAKQQKYDEECKLHS